MIPRLISASNGAYSNGGTSDVSWTHNIEATGINRLFIVAGANVETGGEQNPEEINVAYVGGASAYGTRFDAGGDGNSQEFGSGAYYWLNNTLPAAFGNQTVGTNAKDSPKYAERHRGVSAYFANVRQQAPEASGRDVSNTNSTRSVTITTLTPNALVVAMYANRNGIPSPTWGGTVSVTQICTNDGSPGVGLYLAYLVKAAPGSLTITASATNPEDNALIVAAWAPAKDRGAILFNVL